jgi:hypothetical protein
METMRAMQANDFSIDALSMAQKPVPKPRRGEILVRIKAASLNYRDLAILVEKYLPTLPLPYVPASDACGEVVQTGEENRRFWKTIGDDFRKAIGSDVGARFQPFGNDLGQHVEQEPLGHFLLRRNSLIKFLRFQMQQADFKYVVNSYQYLREFERFADEILCPGFQRAQFVIRLGGDDQYRKIAVRFESL